MRDSTTRGCAPTSTRAGTTRGRVVHAAPAHPDAVSPLARALPRPPGTPRRSAIDRHGVRTGPAGCRLVDRVGVSAGALAASSRRWRRARRHPGRSRTRRRSSACALGAHRLRNDNVAELQVPADHDLGRALAVPVADRAEHGIAERAAPGQRRPRLGHDAVRCVQSARSSACCSHGCSSIWLTAGTTPVSSRMRSRWCGGSWRRRSSVPAPRPAAVTRAR